MRLRWRGGFRVGSGVGVVWGLIGGGFGVKWWGGFGLGEGFELKRRSYYKMKNYGGVIYLFLYFFNF